MCGFCNYYDGSNWEQYVFVCYNQYLLLYGEIDDKAPEVFFYSLYTFQFIIDLSQSKFRKDNEIQITIKSSKVYSISFITENDCDKWLSLLKHNQSVFNHSYIM